MDIQETRISGVFVITPRRMQDERGFFSEVFRSDELLAHGMSCTWVQDNHSKSTARGVVRGLHWQSAPFVQAKLMRVVRGAIFDVAVDIRRGSPTYGSHVAVELSDENWRQLFVPAGFAHGFCTLIENTEVVYKTSAIYAPACEGGLCWHDPDLKIDWPVNEGDAILSQRDREWPHFSELVSPFTYALS